jgi:predicted MPP superfamily phosphohydrolase
MKYYKSLQLLVLISLFCLPLSAQTNLVNYGSSWSYYDNQNEPSDQGALDWNDVLYDDSSWSTGNAELGYGDGDEATNINSNTLTGYFRQEFNVADPNAFGDLNLDLTYDDGAVVYLNGSEVWRVNMPGGTISYGTFSSSTIGNNATTSTTISDVLLTGTNVISVEMHQRSATSSDISFDFQLEANDGSGQSGPDLVVSGSTWKYLDNGSDQGTAWYGTGFDDSSWASGDAELGYGDGNEVTTVSFGPDANNKYPTTYFRHSFTVAEASAIGNLRLEAIRDDGMIVYLNGVEVWRDNMPSGTVDYLTYASSPEISGGAESTWINTTILNSLVSGTNVVAVEIHQQRANSSDISFDFIMTDLGGSPPTSDELVSDSESWNYLDDGSDQGTVWYGTGFDDSSWASGTAELGYGDTQVTTVGFGPDANNKYPTTYFRHTFNVTDPNIYDYVSLEAIRDDGMAVYLNGTLVWSDNMPGTWDYLTYSTAVVGGADETTWFSQAVANTLVAGTNVLAVEIHQTNATSSDISFNFRLFGSTTGGGSANVERGPYLQMGTSSSVVVKWRTDVPTESIVNYGTALGSLNQSESDLLPKTDHEVELTGLSPDTKYFYEIANNNGVYVAESSNIYIKTSPTIGTDQFVRAWILGDPGTEGNNTFPGDQKSVRDAYYAYVNETGPTGSITNPNQTDMMLFLGDNAYNNGTDTEYQAGFFDVYDEMLKKSVAWSCLGNHDGNSVDFNSQQGPYYDIFTFPTAAESGGTASGTEEYYSFDYANIHFIVLQSNNVDGGGSEVTFNTNQKAWLTTDINNTTQDWIVAFFHHPPYTKGSHDSDNSGENGLQTMREQYIPILEAGGVDLILSGHSHSYERSKFVNGHTGLSNTFNPAQTTSGGHTVGANGNLSGRADTADLAYAKTDTDVDGAVYITAGSSGKATGAQFGGQDPYTGANTLPVMYYSLEELGSTILEVENDGSGGQNLNIKFLRETGVIDDYFTINKSGIVFTGTNWYADTDSDTFGDPNVSQVSVSQPPGYVADNTDCDDTNAAINPNTVWYLDADSDNYADSTVIQCTNPGAGYTLTVLPITDCVDSDANINPDATEVCDGIDNNCDGNIDEGLDSDGDGVCDALDICPGFDDNIDTDSDGTPDGCDACPLSATGDSDDDGVCDDADVCPGFDDTIDTDSDGTPDGCDACPLSATGDSDGDGVCDDADVCPGFDDTIDTDSDGTPDGCDACPLSATGDSDGDGVCDDADVCPGFDDTIDSDSDGTPDGCDACPLSATGDSDGDGVCDDADQCPGQDDALIGTSCDDGDDCTTNDVYDANCGCSGTPVADSDGDGVCDDNDICPGFDDNVDTDSDGTPDGCDACPLSATGDSDGDGVCDDADICPGSDDNLDADADGVPDGCDICPGSDDTIDTDSDGTPDGCDACPLSATGDSDGDGVCDDVDICPGFDDNIDTDSDGTPDGCDACPLSATGDSDGDGVCDDVDICPGSDDNIDTDSDGTPDGCDACPLSATGDSDGDGVCDDADICPGSDDNIDTDSDGTPDGCDACPLSATGDSDGDGVCDDADVCPGFDDSLDADFDGVPDGCDQCPGFDDNLDVNMNGIPDDCETGCSYSVIDFNNFNSSWGIWNDGGSDCRRSANDANYSNGGTGRSVRLRDNTSTSVMTTDNLDLSSYEELTVDFNYYVRSMDNSNEDFWLQISTDGGANYTTIEEWNRDDEFVNNNRYFDQVVITGPFTANTRLRFRCDASGNSDWVYIDDVEISGCSSGPLLLPVDEGEVEVEVEKIEPKIIKVYPNPVSQILNIDVSDYHGIKVIASLMDLKGHLLMSKVMNGDYKRPQQLNLDRLADGLYVLILQDEQGQILAKKQIIVQND